MKRILIILLMVASTFCLIQNIALTAKADDVELDNIVEMRGVWVSTVYNIDIARQKTTTEEGISEWKKNFTTILDNAQLYGLNAIFLQVRPSNDAFYQSVYNPWSSYLVSYGKNPGWDPLAWAVEECHARGIELHAWLNPYRVGTLTDENIDHEKSSKAELDAAKLEYAKQQLSLMGDTEVDNPLLNIEDLERFYRNIVVGDTNKLILNPASEDVINHIVNTVEELVTNYDIDGIHYDDYFYLGSFEKHYEGEFYDAYLEEGGTLGLADWRRSNVDRMVKQVSDTLKEVNAKYGKRVAFGISPQGSWKNTYNGLHADPKKWVEEEWIDYILPQIYFSLDGSTIESTYKYQCQWWADVVRPTKVKLFIGSAIYRVTDGTFKSTEMYDQIKWVRSNDTVNDVVSGYVYFSYRDFVKATDQMLLFTKAYFTKGAITPSIIPVDNPGDESGTVSCTEMSSYYSVTVNEVENAKGYLLYAFEPGETKVFDRKHLVSAFSQKTGSGIHTYQTADKTPKEFVLKTLNLNNEVVSKDAHVATTEATVNEAPTVEFQDFVTKEYYIVGEFVDIKVYAKDDTTEKLTATIYHAANGETFRDAKPMEYVGNGIYTYRWEAFGISDEYNSRLKIVVSDGDKEAEIITDYFKVYEKVPVKEYTVVFKDEEGNILKEEKVKEGSSATAPSDPVKEGYNFVGWDKEFNNITGDLEVTAKFEKIEEPVPPVEENGCKKDLALVVVGLISLLSLAGIILRKK